MTGGWLMRRCASPMARDLTMEDVPPSIAPLWVDQPILFMAVIRGAPPKAYGLIWQRMAPRRPHAAEALFPSRSVRRWRLMGDCSSGHTPLRSRRPRQQRHDQIAEQRGVRAVRRERQPHPALAHPHRDLQQSRPDDGEFPADRRLARRDRGPDRPRQPTGRRMEDQSHLARSEANRLPCRLVRCSAGPRAR